MTDELTALRQQMDDVNRRLTTVLHERAQLARRIGAIKRDAGMATTDPEREAAVLDEMLRDLPADGFDADALATILKAVLQASRDIVASERD